MIRHLSFDVWNTLIVPNPYYAEARVKALSELVGVSLEEAKSAYRATKKFVDDQAELNGHGMSTDAVYFLLMRNLGVEQVTLPAVRFRQRVERLFMMMPPKVTDAAREMIAYARAHNMTVSIGSNSNFISGRLMHRYLESRLGELDHGVYSDLIETSKPSNRFFGQVLKNTQVMYRSRHQSIIASEILHIGDNEICDVVGATNTGMHAALIVEPSRLFTATEAKIKEINNV